jgi:hypothetical protein
MGNPKLIFRIRRERGLFLLRDPKTKILRALVARLGPALTSKSVQTWTFSQLGEGTDVGLHHRQ